MSPLLSRILPLALAAVPALAIAADSAPIPAPSIKPGDEWVFDRSHQAGTAVFNQRRLRFRVESVSGDKMVVGLKPDGAPTDFEDHGMGSDWSQRRLLDGKETVTGRPLNFPLTIGKSWTADYVNPNRYGLQTSARFHTTYKVSGWEDVTTPAGTFHCIKVEADTQIEAHLEASSTAVAAATTVAGEATTVGHVGRTPERTVHALEHEEFFCAPEVKYWVKSTKEQFNEQDVRTSKDSDVLESYKVQP